MTAIIQAVHPVLAAREVAVSVQFYRLMGFALDFQDAASDPKYAVMSRDGAEIHLQWADPGQFAYPTDRQACRFIVNDVDALHREFTASGAVCADTSRGSPWAAPGDTPWGTREFHLRDPAENCLQFYQAR